MTSAIWLRNLGAFTLQASLIVAAGAALARALRLHEPRTMLAYWRTLLVVCLLLPFCQPWKHVDPPAAGPAMLMDRGPAGPVVVPVEAAPAGVALPRRVETLALLLLGGGIAARVVWLTIGACALRRMRRRASPFVPLPPAIRQAQARIGGRAGIYLSDGIAGPITFGLFEPVIILPANVPGMPPHVQAAIAYHELVHVRRRDWASGILEEIVCTLLWFHPAIWWLVGRIHLSREQVVDRAVIRLTESREHYLDALLTVALATPPAALRPAPLFLRRSHLKKRIAQILQETTMTTRRLVASLSASAAAVAIAATLAVRSFPLEAQAQAQTRASASAPVAIVKGGDHLLHAALPEYPRRAIEQRVEGDVLLDLSVDDRGEVSDARVLSGPDELRRAALESALQWHYSPAAVRSTSIEAVLRFNATAAGAAIVAEKAEFEGRQYEVRLATPQGRKLDELEIHQRAERQMMEIRQGLESPETTPQQKDELKVMLSKIQEDVAKRDGRQVGFAVTYTGAERPFAGGQARLTAIKTERVPQASVRELLAQAGISVGDVLTEEMAKRVRAIAATIDEHWRVGFQPDGKGGVVLAIIAP